MENLYSYIYHQAIRNLKIRTEMDDVSQVGFEVCPSSWFDSPQDDTSRCRHIWRMTFLSFCLPLCYPCYITRAMRQHSRQKDSTRQEDSTPIRRTSSTYLSPSRSLRHSNSREFFTQSPSSHTLLLSPNSQTSLLSPTPSTPSDQFTTISAMFLHTDPSYSLLNQLDLHTFKKGPIGQQTVAGRANVNLPSSSFELHLVQESSLYEISAEEPPASTTTHLAEIDLLVVVVREEGELGNILGSTKGLVAYITKYWRRYFPVMVVSLGPRSRELKKVEVERVKDIFSNSHFLRLWEGDGTYLLESLARFYQHLFTLHCRRGEEDGDGSLMDPDWVCQGDCGLRATKEDLGDKGGGGHNLIKMARRRILGREKRAGVSEG